jgi:hypothetical protein
LSTALTDRSGAASCIKPAIVVLVRKRIPGIASPTVVFHMRWNHEINSTDAPIASGR